MTETLNKTEVEELIQRYYLLMDSNKVDISVFISINEGDSDYPDEITAEIYWETVDDNPTP